MTDIYQQVKCVKSGFKLGSRAPKTKRINYRILPYTIIEIAGKVEIVHKGSGRIRKSSINLRNQTHPAGEWGCKEMLLGRSGKPCFCRSLISWGAWWHCWPNVNNQEKELHAERRRPKSSWNPPTPLCLLLHLTTKPLEVNECCSHKFSFSQF